MRAGYYERKINYTWPNFDWIFFIQTAYDDVMSGY